MQIPHGLRPLNENDLNKPEDDFRFGQAAMSILYKYKTQYMFALPGIVASIAVADEDRAREAAIKLRSMKPENVEDVGSHKRTIKLLDPYAPFFGWAR